MIVDEVVVGVADQRQVVDVGGAAGGRSPGVEMVSLAVGRIRSADHTSAIVVDESVPLGIGGRADAAALPQHRAISAEHRTDEGRFARDSFHKPSGKGECRR